MSRLTRKYLLLAAICVVPLILALVAAFAPGDSFGLSEPSLRQIAVGFAAISVVGLASLISVMTLRLIKPLEGLAASLKEHSADPEAQAAETTPSGELSELVRALGSLHSQFEQAASARDYLDRLLASISDAILVTDTDAKIVRTNQAAGLLLDCSEETLHGRPFNEILDVDLGSRASAAQALARSSDGTFTRKDGSAVPVSYTVSELRNSRDELEGWIVAAQNTAERRRAENRIKFLARTDPLTRISNRMQFQHQLQQSIARARRSHQYLVLLYMDIDRFKDINDTFGHSAGDRSLEIFAQRIIAELPRGAIAGRLAGDEFAVLLGGLSDMSRVIDQVSETADALLKGIGKPFSVEAQEIYLTSSMGVALYPRDGDNVIDLLRNADAALYQAKRAGGNCYEFYSEEMNNAAVDRLMMKSKLRRAFDRDELRLHYQPKYSLKTGRIEGAEALVRWDLPERGLVFPSDFIPLAEETNLILQVGDWVLNRVCEDYRYWQRSLATPGRVSLNLSLKQLQQQRFLERVQSVFRSHNVPPTCLELEITETTLMDDAERTIRLLNSLYSMGLHLAIDDFGTGYSSLSALQQFPISTLKIDRSFVRDVAIDRDDAAIVSAIILMGHSLGMDVVAEGVESQQQLEFLRAQGCDYVQGHLFGDPTTAEGLRELLIDQAEGSMRHRKLFA
ncbi:MAG TPA: EAL domain-containing protein [Gammaproteobacteria bacterium]|jgi:diguanylate cyclase (GGDEF)-like protein/PAS domain S-box-containing protein